MSNVLLTSDVTDVKTSIESIVAPKNSEYLSNKRMPLAALVPDLDCCVSIGKETSKSGKATHPVSGI